MRSVIHAALLAAALVMACTVQPSPVPPEPTAAGGSGVAGSAGTSGAGSLGGVGAGCLAAEQRLDMLGCPEASGLQASCVWAAQDGRPYPTDCLADAASCPEAYQCR
jgi:hypothetical protein